MRLTPEAGGLPVADTQVTWTMGANQLSGSTTTDEDGRFVVYIRTDLLVSKFEEMVIRVAKNSSDVVHQYECDGIPCTERRVLVEHLTFDVSGFADGGGSLGPDRGTGDRGPGTGDCL